MKKGLFFFMAALALTVVACNPEKKGGSEIDWSKVTVDGFYVAGPATGSDEIKPECVMAAGFNEVDKAVREGMYEKYIVLEADKDFYLLYNDGGNKTRYSAELAEFVTPLEENYTDNPEKVLKGKMIEGESAPAMKVAKTGLYHIVLDLNKAGDLKEPQILLLDASDFGVRGGMNSWGFTSSDPKVTEFTNDGITFTFKDQELAKNGEFKFATGNYWKVTLDDAGKVKAETSLAEGMTLNGANIKVEKGGLYDITLTFKLAQGAFDKSFSYTAVCTKESTAPENMYMIGSQWGNWTWDDAGVAELVPVYGAPGYFWITRYFQAGGEFKFCAVKAWNGDFGDNGNNIKIDDAGFYTILVNGNDNTFEIKPAEVYGIGDAVFGGGWDFDSAVKFQEEGEKLVITTTGAGELRLASKVVPSAAIDGVTTPNGWIDWWKTEFIFFEDGKIEYRGAGNDQARVKVEAGQKITLDFNAGTAEIGGGFEPAIAVDGDLSDWADVAEFTSEANSRIRTWKVTSDAKNVYVLVSMRKNRADKGRKLTIGFNTDKDATTGKFTDNNNMKGCEAVAYQLIPFTNASGEAPVCVNGVLTEDKVYSTAEAETAGVVSVYAYDDGSDLASDSSNICLEISIPKSALALPATEIQVGASYDYYFTGYQAVTL